MTGDTAPAAPGRYREKGDAAIEALHWDGYPTTATVLVDWILASGGTARYHDGPSALVIDVPGGTVVAVPGDWIGRRTDGVFWAWTEEDFAAGYEPADDLRSAPDDAYIAEHGSDDLETGHLRDPEGDEAAHG